MMKSPFQKQNQQWQRQQQQRQQQQWQQQQQQWQQQLRQRQMGAVAAQQQQKQQQAQAARLMQANDPFARAEATMAELRLKARSGRLSQQQLEARLQELTVQDAAGHYWMLGYDTGTWYRHEGGQWVAAIPPGRFGIGPGALAAPLHIGAGAIAAQETHPFLGCATFTATLIGVGFLGLMLFAALEIEDPTLLLIGAIICLAIAIGQAKRAYGPR